MRVRPARKRVEAAGSRLARVTAGRDKATLSRLADALAEQEFSLKEKLVRARKSAELEQVDIADIIGVDKSTISRFERLDSNPTLAMIRNYAYAIGCLVKYDVVNFPEPSFHERISQLLELLDAVLKSPIRPATMNPIDFSLQMSDFEFYNTSLRFPATSFSPIASSRSVFGSSGTLTAQIRTEIGR